MTLKGGTVSFTDKTVKDETKKQKLILDILNYESTRINSIAVVNVAEKKKTEVCYEHWNI